MSDLPRYPDTTGKDVTKRIDELENYIINLHRFLRFALETIDEKNMTAGARGQFLEIKGLYTELYADETGLLSRMTNAEGGVSTLQQNVNGLTSTVQANTGDISDLQGDVLNAEGNISTLGQNMSTLTQTVQGFSLDVTNGLTSSTIKLKSGEAEFSSQTISMNGLVKFTDLATAGSTVINGGNITTGTISAVNIGGCTIDGGFFSQSSQDSTQNYLDSLEVQYGKLSWYRAPISNPYNRTLVGELGMVDEEGNYYINFGTENNIPLKLYGNISANKGIQFGTTSEMNAYAKFIAHSNGNYYGWHADGSDNFYLHKQNASGSVLASIFAYYSNGGMKIEANSDMKLYSQEPMEFHARQNVSSRYFLIGCANANDGLDFRPDIDNQCNIGTSSQRFYKMYSANGVATTSDKRVKNSIDDDLSTYDTFFAALRSIKYKYNSDGEAAKFRIGFVAQEVEQALIDAGLTVDDFAGLFKDDISSSPVRGIDDNIMYGLNYAEFVALNTRMIQKQQAQIDDLTARITALEGSE